MWVVELGLASSIEVQNITIWLTQNMPSSTLKYFTLQKKNNLFRGRKITSRNYNIDCIFLILSFQIDLFSVHRRMIPGVII